MRCVNCNKNVPDNKVIFFLQVLLCSKCAETVRVLRDRARSELENVMASLDDSFRIALSERRVNSTPITLTWEETLGFVLSIYKYAREKNLCSSSQITPSTENTQLPASTVDGSENLPKD